MDANAAGSSASGASDDKIVALAAFRATDLFTPAERAALELAEEMTQTRADVADATFDALRPHFTEAQIVELAGAVAMENFRARFNRAFDVEAQGTCPIPGLRTPPPSS